MKASAPTILAVAVLVAAVAAAADLRQAQARTLVVYTTPALQDVLQNDIIPRFQNATGLRVEPVFVAAGEQYNRLRMSGYTPEADVFLHASPLFIEKGFDDGSFEAIQIPEAVRDNASFESRAVEGGRVWYSFAWSPLVEVYSPRFVAPPDLATADVRFGLAHPLLSNNGIYNVLFFEQLNPDAGKHAIAHTAVQPVNARGSINGIADGSFDVTLGYEAVSLFYASKGAHIAFGPPMLDGNATTVPVQMSVGLVKSHLHPDALQFLRFLFTDETQSHLARYGLRSVRDGAEAPDRAVDLGQAETIHYDWSRWRDLEAKLKDYEVKS